jgi:hypothetical protein
MSGQYLGVIVAGLGSMLAGASVVHWAFAPKLELPPLDLETQAKLDAVKAQREIDREAVLEALKRGEVDEASRLLRYRLEPTAAAGQAGGGSGDAPPGCVVVVVGAGGAGGPMVLADTHVVLSSRERRHVQRSRVHLLPRCGVVWCSPPLRCCSSPRHLNHVSLRLRLAA